MAQRQEQLSIQQQVVAHARDLRIAPRKLRLVADLVRGQMVDRALTQLQFTHKKGAAMVRKLILSAIANAEHNFSLRREGLSIASISCDAARVMRRFMPRARGSASPINRQMSHLYLALHYIKPIGKHSRQVGPQLPKAAAASGKAAEPLQESEAQTAASNAEITGRHASFKPSEKIKQNIVAQKRRLWNRRSGE